MSAFHSLAIADLRKETADAISLSFAIPPDLKEAFKFSPGQYLTLRAAIDGEECRRSYSICSAQTERELRVAIKKTPNGRFSTFANERLQAGAHLEVMPPQGRFTGDFSRAGHYVFIAAGSGVTPILSMIKSLLAENARAQATLIYGNRLTASILFREALEDLKDVYLERLAIFHVLSRESQDIDILNGRIDRDKVETFLKTIIPPQDVVSYFLCGPYGMIEEAKAALHHAGVAAERVKSELFSTDGLPPGPVVVAAPNHGSVGASHVACVLDGVTYRLDIKPDQHIVAAAHEQGVELPYSCKGGMCCTCRCKVVEGEVIMDVNYSLEPWEIEAGFVLACQSRPLSEKVKLDFDAA